MALESVKGERTVLELAAEYDVHPTTDNGDSTTAEVHRRMAETYGAREGSRSMSNMVLQSQVDWLLRSKSDNGNTLPRKTSIAAQSPENVQWLSKVLITLMGQPLGLDALAEAGQLCSRSPLVTVLAMGFLRLKLLLCGQTVREVGSFRLLRSKSSFLD